MASIGRCTTFIDIHFNGCALGTHWNTTRPGPFEKYVNTHQGAFNQQLSTVDIPLVSTLQVTTLAQELKDSYYIFGITLQLTWHVSMAEVQDILRAIAQSGAVTLHIDGINPDTCQRLFNLMETNFGDLQLVALLNYPRPFESHVYLKSINDFVHGLHLSSLSEYDWQDAPTVLESCGKLLAEWREHPARIDTILHGLSVTLFPLRALDLKGIVFLTGRPGRCKDGSEFKMAPFLVLQKLLSQTTLSQNRSWNAVLYFD